MLRSTTSARALGLGQALFCQLWPACPITASITAQAHSDSQAHGATCPRQLQGRLATALHRRYSQQQEQDKGGDASSAGGQQQQRQELRLLLLDASLQHVKALGWSHAALVAGARDLNLSPAAAGVVGPAGHGEAELVQHFIRTCNEKLAALLQQPEQAEVRKHAATRAAPVPAPVLYLVAVHMSLISTCTCTCSSLSHESHVAHLMPPRPLACLLIHPPAPASPLPSSARLLPSPACLLPPFAACCCLLPPPPCLPAGLTQPDCC